jgi:hypothetical protein
MRCLVELSRACNAPVCASTGPLRSPLRRRAAASLDPFALSPPAQPSPDRCLHHSLSAEGQRPFSCRPTLTQCPWLPLECPPVRRAVDGRLVLVSHALERSQASSDTDWVQFVGSIHHWSNDNPSFDIAFCWSNEIGGLYCFAWFASHAPSPPSPVVCSVQPSKRGATWYPSEPAACGP